MCVESSLWVVCPLDCASAVELDQLASYPASFRVSVGHGCHGYF